MGPVKLRRLQFRKFESIILFFEECTIILCWICIATRGEENKQSDEVCKIGNHWRKGSQSIAIEVSGRRSEPEPCGGTSYEEGQRQSLVLLDGFHKLGSATYFTTHMHPLTREVDNGRYPAGRNFQVECIDEGEKLKYR